MKIEQRNIPALQREIIYLVGMNAQDNFYIIDAAEPTDLWFHLSDYSSCHVIAKLPPDIQLDKKQKLQIVKQGALVCKQHSKYKSVNNLKVIYTPVSNVIKQSIIGQVEALHTKDITV
jgi:predicted ribosome quality control (RQC) complex YloA/Tae2 family protein